MLRAKVRQLSLDGKHIHDRVIPEGYSSSYWAGQLIFLLSWAAFCRRHIEHYLLTK